MTKNFLYFQPEYVCEFVCDGAKCPHNCCEKHWNIEIDEETYERYTRIQPASKAREITDCFGRNDTGKYFLKDRPCPFLTEKKLCRLQLEYGENFLSLTCATFPRQTFDFGKFFERSLSPACPLAAEMILFRDAPLTFELVELPKADDERIGTFPLPVPQEFVPHFLDVQIAMISILQERTLTIDQRLIVLGFFLDRLDEIISDGLDVDALTKLIAAYESKDFLSTQVPRMLATLQFDAGKFSERMLQLLENLYINAPFGIVNLVTETLKNFSVLADARKNFLARRSMFPENFLVNELFMTCFPWNFKASLAKNFAIFVVTYKLFELPVFAAELKNFGDEKLLALTDWFVTMTYHLKIFRQRISACVPDDIFVTMESFLQP